MAREDLARWLPSAATELERRAPNAAGRGSFQRVDDVVAVVDGDGDDLAWYPLGGGGGVSLSNDNPANLGARSPGVGVRASRWDHVHQMPTAAEVGAVPLSRFVATQTPLGGGGQLTGDLILTIAAASEDTRGTMSIDDFLKLADIEDGATRVLLATEVPLPDAGSGDVGDSLKAAREDHVHPLVAPADQASWAPLPLSGDLTVVGAVDAPGTPVYLSMGGGAAGTNPVLYPLADGSFVEGLDVWVPANGLTDPGEVLVIDFVYGLTVGGPLTAVWGTAVAPGQTGRIAVPPQAAYALPDGAVVGVRITPYGTGTATVFVTGSLVRPP